MDGFGNQALWLAITIVWFIASVEVAAMEASSAEKKLVREDAKFVISPPKTVVRIYNELGDGLNLSIHCKSKDDDLGVHVIVNTQDYYWQFKVNFLGTTLFFCRFSWRDNSGAFDIYKAGRDLYRCPTKCNWQVFQDGIHGLRQADNVTDILFKWS